jgi:serine/threonine-protein kinase
VPPEVLEPAHAEGLAAEELLQSLWADQRRLWPRGEGVPARAYLERYPALAADPERAAALIFNEFVVREARGERPSFNDYLAGYPAYASELGDLYDADRLVELPAGSAAGDRLGDYELLGELGRGGQAVVYKARSLRLDRLVALKMFVAGGHTGPAELERFRREARVLARFPHPNIVPIYDIGEADGGPFLALEFMSGGSLAQQLGGVAQPPRKAAELLLLLARAMQVVHRQGIVHRDLKPGNILFTADGVPKITDFGLAKNLSDQSDLSRTGLILGTASYMAPEQARGKPREVGPAADVYALGAILYEMLTGRP